MKKLNKNLIMTPLRLACSNTKDVKDSFCSGLGAIQKSERMKIKVPDTRKIYGSINIDESTKERYPNANRWDYAIEYDNETFFIEIHPATTNEIKTVLTKLEWIKLWLCNEATAINAIKSGRRNPYHWVSTVAIAILPNSKYAKILAQAKLTPVKSWDYSKIPIEEKRRSD